MSTDVLRSVQTGTETSELEKQLDAKIDIYRTYTFTTATKKTYSTHKKRYLEFCLACGYDPVPVTNINLCRYAAYLARRLSYSSTRQYLNIIRLMHLECGFPNPLEKIGFWIRFLKGSQK